MTGSIWFRSARVLVSVGLAATILIVLAGVLERFLTIPGLDSNLTSATLSHPGADSQTIALPQFWRGPDDEIEARTYTFTLQLDELPTESLYGYVPFFDQRLKARLNGVEVYDSRSVGRWDPLSLATALLPLPRELLVEGSNELIVVVETGPIPIGAMSPLAVGSLSTVQPVYYVRLFLRNTGRAVLFGMQVFLAISGLLIFGFRPQDKTFGWLGLLMSLTSLLGFGVLANIIPNIEVIFRHAFLLVPAAGLSLLGFSLSLTRFDVSRQVLIAMIAVTVILFVLVFAFGVPAISINFGFAVPVLILCVAVSATILLRIAIEEPLPEILIFIIGLFLLGFGIAHDFAIRLGIFESGVLLSVFSRLFNVIAIAVFIVRRVVSQAEQLDVAAADLRLRLADKERELASVYEEQRKRDAAELIDKERSRVTADLHDGVAGHLTTIVALSEQSQTPTDEIKKSARNALLDLRLVIDTMAVKTESLRYYLGLFRDRVIQPLESLDIEISWSMTGLPNLNGVHPEPALNIMRILQEAVNNALRHSEVRKIEIIGGSAGDDMLTLTVRNLGNPVEATGGSGFGLGNMRRRAGELGGSVTFDKDASGALVTLTIPCSALSSSQPAAGTGPNGA